MKMTVKDALDHVWPITPEAAREVLANGWANGSPADPDREVPALTAMVDGAEADEEVEVVHPAYRRVLDLFAEVYEELRDYEGGNAPNSYTWLAPTLSQLVDDAPMNDDKDIDQQIGRGQPIAYIYECNGRQLFEVRESVTDEQIKTLLADCMGLNEVNEETEE